MHPTSSWSQCATRSKTTTTERSRGRFPCGHVLIAALTMALPPEGIARLDRVSSRHRCRQENWYGDIAPSDVQVLSGLTRGQAFWRIAVDRRTRCEWHSSVRSLRAARRQAGHVLVEPVPGPCGGLLS